MFGASVMGETRVRRRRLDLFAEEKWILATSNSIWSDEMVARHRNPPSALLPALFRSLEAR